MLYNKNNVRKTNDKKILHKVGKQWKVVSVALLMAIGGGAAVATHANAQSNNGVNASTSAEVAALDTKPAVQSAQSVAPSSASASASASAKPASKVSYLSGDNGSAASYRDNTLNDRYAMQSNGDVMNGYVKSLNAKFPTATKYLNGRAASASANAKSDANLANSYSAVAKNGNSAAVSALASKAGLTVSDYEGAVQVNASNYSSTASNANKAANALSLLSSVAFDLSGTDLTVASAQANADEALASANQRVVSAKANSSAVNNANQAVENNNSALTNATVASIEASGADQAALDASGDDASLVNSFAKSLTHVQANSSNAAWTSSAVSAEVQSYASNTAYVSFANATNPDADNYLSAEVVNEPKFSNANSVAVSTHDLDAVLKDTAVMSAAGSVKASANSTIASANAAKASLSNAVVSASANYKAATAELSSANAALDAAAFVNGQVQSLSNDAKAHSTANNDGKSAALSDAVKGANVNALSNAVKGMNLYEKMDLASMASAAGVDVLALKGNGSAMASLAEATENASGSTMSDKASSVAKSVATSVANATNSSASYANATDENVTLASYFASSYSNDASNESALASDYANSANDFYLAFANSSAFTSADNAYRAAKSAEPNDAALANAFGNRVFNYAPKYVTVQKQVALYHVANSKYSWVVNVPAGVRLTVTGVQIMQNGAVRYQTSYKGKKGTVNSYKSYVQQTYLPAMNGVDVTVVKPSKVYASVSKNGFGKVAAKALPAGAQLSNVNIISADNVYGGFTAIETQSGKFVSANIAYAKVNNANANNNEANGSTNSNHASFWA